MVLALEHRALWVVPVADLGGVARHVLDVATCGIPGCHLTVLTPAGPLADRLRELGTAVVEADFGPEAGVNASLASLRSAIRKLRPDVVHTHLAYADIVAAATLALDRHTLLVTTEHGIAPDDALYNPNPVIGRAKRFVHRARLARFDRVIAVSNSTASVMKSKWEDRRICVIPNGIDPGEGATQRRSLGEGARLLSLSRLAAEKRIDQVIKAMPQILQRDPAARLTIAGTGPEEASLKQLADGLSVADAIDFSGYLDSGEALANHDVLIQLSTWENLSYALLDARASGLHVVATRVGGNPEIFEAETLLADASPEQIVQSLQAGGARPLATPLPSVSDMTRAIAAVYSGMTC